MIITIIRMDNNTNICGAFTAIEELLEYYQDINHNDTYSTGVFFNYFDPNNDFFVFTNRLIHHFNAVLVSYHNNKYAIFSIREIFVYMDYGQDSNESYSIYFHGGRTLADVEFNIIPDN